MLCSLQGHFKVVKFLVDHVSQFPSDAELTRYISTLSDKVQAGVHLVDLTQCFLSTCTCTCTCTTCACTCYGWRQPSLVYWPWGGGCFAVMKLLHHYIHVYSRVACQTSYAYSLLMRANYMHIARNSHCPGIAGLSVPTMAVFFFSCIYHVHVHGCRDMHMYTYTCIALCCC